MPPIAGKTTPALAGPVLVIFGAHPRWQPRFLAAAPQFIRRFVDAYVVECAQRKVQFIVAHILHESNRAADRAKVPPSQLGALPGLGMSGELHGVALKDGVAAERAAVHAAAGHAMTDGNAHRRRAHTKTHGAARAAAGLFHGFGIGIHGSSSVDRPYGNA